MKKNWKKFLCLTHFDLHIAASEKAGEGFDPEEFARRVKASGVDAAYIMAKCACGYCYYPTDIGYRHPNLKCDMHGLSMEALRRENLGVLAYIGGGFDGYATKKYPQWRFTFADGTHPDRGPEYGVMCLYGPYLEEVFLPQVREYLSRYEPDMLFSDTMDCTGICHCDDCRKKFRDLTGSKFPKKAGDPGWEQFGAFRMELRQNYARRLIETVRSVNPKMPVATNWMYCPQIMPVTPHKDLAYLTGDYNALQGFSFLSRYWSASGKRFEIMTGRGIHDLPSPTMRPLDQYKQLYSMSAYLGGRCCVIDLQRPDGSIDASVHGSLGRVHDFLHEHFPNALDMKAVPDTAVLHGLRAFMGEHLEHMADPDNFTRLGAVEGVHRCLLERGRHFSILREEGFEKRMKDFRAVILPEQKILSKEIAGALENYVKKGGTLIATHPCGGEEHHKVIEKVFGVRYKGDYDGEFVFLDWHEELKRTLAALRASRKKWCDSPEILPLEMRTKGIMDVNVGEKRDVPIGAALPGIYEATDAEVLADMATPKPGWKRHYPWMEPYYPEQNIGAGITVKRLGKGKAIFIAAPIFGFHSDYHDPAIADLAEVLLDMAVEPAQVTLDGPPEVAMSLMKGQGVLDVHLVNTSGEWFNWRFGKTAGMAPTVKCINHVRNMVVRLRTKKRPKKVVAIPGGKALAFKRKGEEILIPVKDLHIHTCIRIKS